ncbi:hypothetical protein PAAG_12034 [Paracoccidioides lutzii Pb01]|uniref:Uncharacterized protein n=1 Tax=Paracoccidioides lutzii (strain ATCC MYA-826 / Pb01) TaxID=502779 RepID=A0A0A2V1A1_PARBA|nr:hypothetical protein PAAG_12034 [Paracoccidioides lutzii Pb01]KGQ01263.1 hypothetical protein PAAG_12034 [Paracoccidioides lutzii Pb01]
MSRQTQIELHIFLLIFWLQLAEPTSSNFLYIRGTNTGNLIDSALQALRDGHGGMLADEVFQCTLEPIVRVLRQSANIRYSSQKFQRCGDKKRRRSGATLDSWASATQYNEWGALGKLWWAWSSVVGVFNKKLALQLSLGEKTIISITSHN